MQGIKDSNYKISSVIDVKGKNRQSLYRNGKKTPNEYSKKERPVANQVKRLVTEENSPMQKLIAKFLNTSVTTIKIIINQCLQIKKAKKHSVDQLLLRHVSQYRTFCRILYENYLAEEINRNA